MQYIKTLALEDPIIAKFVKDADWKSQCCAYTTRNDTTEMNIKFVNVVNQNFLRINFDLDTLKIINIDMIGMHRIGTGLK